MISEFKKFILKGNVIDLSVAVVIGAAFGRVVSSFVADILMPPIGLLLGRVDFSNLFLNLSGGQYGSLAEARQAGAATINYGIFINTLISLIIVGLAVFAMVKMISHLRSVKEEMKLPLEPCPYCLVEIPKGAKKCAHCTADLNIRAVA
jgi:large conductance mechanosensitive channel